MPIPTPQSAIPQQLFALWLIRKLRSNPISGQKHISEVTSPNALPSGTLCHPNSVVLPSSSSCHPSTHSVLLAQTPCLLVILLLTLSSKPKNPAFLSTFYSPCLLSPNALPSCQPSPHPVFLAQTPCLLVNLLLTLSS